VHEALSPLGLTVITVALDKDPEDARPWIEAARPSHPSLVDTTYALADSYNIVNVPTMVWIDEQGMIARPNDVGYATDTFRKLHRVDSQRILAAIREWVEHGTLQFDRERVRELQALPDAAHQQARTEFALGGWLSRHGRPAAAERHFLRAGELAPHDFTIRRGSMPMRGIDSMGKEFYDMVIDWVGSGHSYYTPLPE
jgi:hypothetical protein